MTVTLQALSAGDLALLERVASEVFDNPVDPAAAARFLADERHHLVVAVDADVVIGFASGVHYFHPDKPVPELFVNEVGVAPTHQNQGVGKALLRCLFQRGRELGCAQAWVLTDGDNVPAQRLYAASGGTTGAGTVMFSFELGDEKG